MDHSALGLRQVGVILNKKGSVDRNAVAVDVDMLFNAVRGSPYRTLSTGMK